MLLIRLSGDEPVCVLRPEFADDFDHLLDDPLVQAVRVLPVVGLDASHILHVLERTMALSDGVYQFNDAMAHIYWHNLIQSHKFLLMPRPFGWVQVCEGLRRFLDIDHCERCSRNS